MIAFVGSTNPVKINAVKQAAIHQWPDLTIQGFSTKSGIAEQPTSDDETRHGATNRARSALEQGLKTLDEKAKKTTPILAFGLEGGVFTDAAGQMWSTVWVAVVDTDGKHFEANGGIVKVPDSIASIIAQGGEMGPVIQQLTGEQDVKQKQGMFGIITNNYVDRTEEYRSIAKMALGLWYGQGWDANLRST